MKTMFYLITNQLWFLTFPLPHCFLVQITGIREDRKSRRGVDLDEVIFILAIIVIAYMVYKEVVKRR